MKRLFFLLLQSASPALAQDHQTINDGGMSHMGHDMGDMDIWGHAMIGPWMLMSMPN